MNGPPIWTGHKKRRLGISSSPKGIFLSIVKKVCSLTQPFFQSEKLPNIKISKLKIVFCSIWNLGTCNRGSLPTQPTLDAAFCSAPQVGTVVNLNKERLGGVAGWICGLETGALMSKVFLHFFSCLPRENCSWAWSFFIRRYPLAQDNGRTALLFVLFCCSGAGETYVPF